jgi:serine/threonine protein kinase/tetratricopeptide (TPR) repeat protein
MSEFNLIGKSLGRFEVISELGRGGMAIVYKARQTDLDRIVALKLLPPGLTHDTAYVARFRQEARSAARLEHPHIMPIYEVGEANGMHYIAMKFIEGRTVKDIVADEGALSVQRAALILAQVGEALDYAHRHGVIHRDIKPSNMMATPEGWVYLTDFGLARGTGGDTSGLTMAGTVMGTPEYMSPEQAQGLPNVGPPTDIYALGVVLYELLTGAFPFNADTPMGMLAARLLQAPTPPRDIRGDLPTAVEDVVMRALARKPEARFPNAAAMVAALRSASGIGNAEPERPATPVGGMPAMGATIKAPALATPMPPAQPTPPSNPPYVRPADATIAANSPSVRATPAPALQLPPSAVAQQRPAAPEAKKGPNNLVVIASALALVLVLSCVGLFMLGANSSDGPITSPTAVTSSGVQAILDEGDEALAEEGGIEDAIASYQQALDEEPGSPAALEKLALAYSARADWVNAEEYANQLIDAEGSSDQQVALGHALLADAVASQGDVVAAAASAAEAVRIDPDLAFGHAVQSNLESAAAAATGDRAAMDTALDTLGRAEDALADEAPLLEALTRNALGYTFAQEYLLSGDQTYFDQSEDSYEQAIDLLPNLGAFHANRAYLYSAAGDFEEARDGFDEALDLDPRLTTAQSGIGWSYYQEGDAEQAAAAFDKALALDNRHFDAYYGKGRLAFDGAEDQAGYAAAAEQFRQAAERNPHSAEVQAYLGESLLFQGFQSEEDSADQDEAYAAAEEAYRQAIALNDHYAFAQSGLGWILQYQEEYEESVQVFQRALELDDTTDEVHNGLAWSLYNLGRHDEAEASFRAAIERDDDNNYASAHYGLGVTLEALGRTDEARAEYEAALAIDPSYSDAQEALDALGS